MSTSSEITKRVIKTDRSRLLHFLGLFEGRDKALIVINPDPDSMAGAMAVKRLLWKRVNKISIAHIGEIHRLDNLAMIALLKIPLIRLDKIDREAFTRRILVDSQPDHSEILEQMSYDVIIDHHPQTKKWKVPHVDIRPEYGATSTMLIEYLRRAKVKPSVRLATALLYGIKTDTANFERGGTEEDIKQFQYVYQHANMHVLRKIETSELRLTDLRFFQRALDHRIVAKKGLYAHLGRVPGADICVQVADFFMRVHDVRWAFVSGVSADKLFIIMRNDGYRKNAGKLAKRAFGNLGTAGGHEGAARVEIPLEALRQKGIPGYGAGLKAFVRDRLKL